MKVLYHIRPYFVGISPYIGLIMVQYLHFRILKFPLINDNLYKGTIDKRAYIWGAAEDGFVHICPTYVL